MAAVAQSPASQLDMKHRNFILHSMETAGAPSELDERETDTTTDVGINGDADFAGTQKAESPRQPPVPQPPAASAIGRRRCGRKATPRRTVVYKGGVNCNSEQEDGDDEQEAGVETKASVSKRQRLDDGDTGESTERLCFRCCRPFGEESNDGEPKAQCPACPRLYHPACWLKGGAVDGQPCAECQALLESETVQLAAVKDPSELAQFLGRLAEGLVAITDALAEDDNGRKCFLTSEATQEEVEEDCPSNLRSLRRKARDHGFATVAAYLADIRLMGHKRLERLRGKESDEAAIGVRALLHLAEQLTSDLLACVHCYSAKDAGQICPKPHPLVWASPAGQRDLWPGRDLGLVPEGSADRRQVRVHFFGFKYAASGSVQLVDSDGVFLHSETPDLPTVPTAEETKGEEATHDLALTELRDHLERLRVAGHSLARPRTSQRQPYTSEAAASFFDVPDEESPLSLDKVATHRWLESVKSDAVKAFTIAVESYLARCKPPTQHSPAEQLQLEEMQKSESAVLEQTRHLSRRLTVLRKQHAVEMAKLHFMHQLQAFELEHNHRLAMCELRAAFDIEKQNLVNAAYQAFEADARRQVEETKRKQWCAYCAKEAFFYCCWNTSYCDAKCQQNHWPQHMTNCSQARPGSSAAGVGIAVNSLPLQVSPAGSGFHPVVSQR